MGSAEQFYDQLAADYHLIYDDWVRGAIPRQANALDALIRSEQGPPPLTVLDCTCGIGTQAIGLAQRGYAVTGTDISANAVQRARTEAERLVLDIAFNVADLRTLAEQVEGTFDVVLSCDNSLPHLLTDEDLEQAVDNLWKKVRPGGLLVVGIRDYDLAAQERPAGTLPRMFSDVQGRRITFQVWEWAPDGRTYTLHLFMLREQPEGWETREYVTEYRALLRAELTALLQAAGFTDIRRHMPDETGHHQPLVTARKAQ